MSKKHKDIGRNWRHKQSREKKCKKVHTHETKIPLSKTDFPDKEVRPNTLVLAWVTRVVEIYHYSGMLEGGRQGEGQLPSPHTFRG